MQVCLEGQISRKSAMKISSESHQPSGDQISSKLCEQFQDNVFLSRSGARIVRIAVHPSGRRLRYGSTAVELLTRYYGGQLSHYNEDNDGEIEEPEVNLTEAVDKVSLLDEKITPKANLLPLLVNLRERRPEKLHFLGVSFGLTHVLFHFWRKLNFKPFYIEHIPSSVTGEHVTGEYSCIVLRPLNNNEIEASEYGFLAMFYQEFRKQYSKLLGLSFRKLDLKLAMSILALKIDFQEHEPTSGATNDTSSLRNLLSPDNMKRLEAYTNCCVDYRTILDLVPILAHQYFQEKIPITLSPIQASILFCMGMQQQYEDITYIEDALKLDRNVIFSNFIKLVKMLYNYLYKIAAKETESALPRLKEEKMEVEYKKVGFSA